MKNNELKKKVSILTFGCQMNENDSEIIRSILAQAGFSFTDDEADAEIILLNTCAVRDNAVRKVYGAISDIRHRRKGRPVTIGVLGCIPTHLGQELLDNKHVKIDFIAGPDSYRRLPELIQTALDSNKKPSDLELSKEENYDGVIPKRQEGVNAWVTVMRGCDNFCAFCVVPYTRGRERSRAPDKVLNEIRQAVANRYPQVTLLGQNVNSYSYKDCDFAGLLDQAAQIPGLKRIRFTAPHPKDFPENLLQVMAAHKNICKHIHLPVQSGNSRILKLMNRSYSREDYLGLVEKIRCLVPQVALTTDIIVGFPTETDEEFNDTFTLVEKVQFEAAFIFKYSERKGTLAAKKFKDDVPAEKKTERIVKLNELQRAISLKKNSALIGATFEVLIEAESTARSNNQFQGRTDGNTIVIVPKGPYSIGQFITVTVTDATVHALKGKIAADKTAF